LENINDNFFDGHYKEIWKNIIPEVLTVKEVDFMISYFGLQPGSTVLDLMCGYGRHVLALGRKGIAVTAVDNLAAYLEEIKTAVAAENLPVKTIQQNVVDYIPDSMFDLVICMGNSLNFFNAAAVQKIFAAVSAGLKPGGHLLINSWTIAEIIFRNFKESSEGDFGGLKLETRMKMLFQPARTEAESTFTTPGGETETKTGIDYIYSLNEMESMLLGAGLSLKKVYSIPGRKEFTLGEPRAYLVAEKR